MRKQVTLWVRKQVEVNTDPQRRCYNGCHARSEMVWTDWQDLFDCATQASAEDTMHTFQRINPTHEYRVCPIGVHPSEVQNEQ